MAVAQSSKNQGSNDKGICRFPVLLRLKRLIGLTKSSEDFDLFFKKTFDKLFEGLHRYAFTLLKDKDAASDAVQSVFIKWWETRKSIDDQAIKFYLYTGVYRQCLNVIRNEKTKVLRYENYRQEYAVSFSAFDDTATFKELDDLIKEAINELPPQCGTIFKRSRFEDKRYTEIAAEMNLSIKTVEAQMGKALRILKERLTEYL